MSGVSTTAIGVLTLGFGLGLRHALDVDHLAAVSAFVSRRRGVWSSSVVGVLWGLGHTVSLLAVALLVIVLHVAIPEWVAHALELGVAAMLIAIGANLLVTLWRGGALHVHVHRHGDRQHVHLHAHVADGAPRRRTTDRMRAATERPRGHDHAGPGRRPFYVGLVHGLAGSAGLMLAVVAAIPSRPLAVAYVATFGCGSIGGMLVMTMLLGVPLTLAADRLVRIERWLQLCAAACCVAVGVFVAWRVGLAAGMFA